MAFALLIGNYVVQQYHVAYENPDHARIFAVGSDDYIVGSWWDKDEYLSKIPEVEAASRFGYATMGSEVAMVEDQGFAPVVISVDKSFFDIFPYYSLVEGSLSEFTLYGKCLVTEDFANKISKDSGSVIGKIIESNFWPEDDGDPQKYEIIGVVKNFRNTLVQSNIDVIICAEQHLYYAKQSTPFTSIGAYVTLIKAKEGSDRNELQDKVIAVNSQNYNWQSKWQLFSLDELYFNDKQFFFNGGSKSTLQMLVVVVLLLLVCAIFNYINLNMALSGKRAKEMATRRLLGASQKSILIKYIIESVVFTLICFILALLIAKALVPMMDELIIGSTNGAVTSERAIHLNLGLSLWNILVYLIVAIVIGILAGIVPAIFASRFAPIDIVRGKFRRRNKMIFSKVFIIFQNAVAVVLIAMALLMEAQMRHMLNRPLNARSENLYYIESMAFSKGDEASPLISSLMALPQVKSVGIGRGVPSFISMSLGLPSPEGSDEKYLTIHTIIADTTYFRLLGIHPLEDRGIGAQFGAVWLSRSAAEAIQLSDSTEFHYARNFRINGAEGDYIGGIYEDIPTKNASETEQDTKSAIVVDHLEKLFYPNAVLVETIDESKGTERAIMDVYQDFCEQKLGIYTESGHGYLKPRLASLLDPVKKGMRLIELFAVLAVMISLLGLLAMSTYFSDESTKEIAIRKVFGSDVNLETKRSVKSYMILIGISCLIGIPLAIYIAGEYLKRFAYRITSYWWAFVAAVLIMAVIALATIFWQIRRAALTNPATELKKE